MQANTFNELNTCFHLPQAFGIDRRPNMTLGQATGEYLDEFCSDQTPVCPADVLHTTAAAFRSNCGTISPGSFIGVTLLLLEHYDLMRPILCTKNQTTDSFCVVDMLDTVAGAMDRKLDVLYIWDVLNRDTSALLPIVRLFESGRLCTGCISGFVDNARRMGYISGEDEALPFFSTIRGKCGQDFGSEFQWCADNSVRQPSRCRRGWRTHHSNCERADSRGDTAAAADERVIQAGWWTVGFGLVCYGCISVSCGVAYFGHVRELSHLDSVLLGILGFYSAHMTPWQGYY